MPRPRFPSSLAGRLSLPALGAVLLGAAVAGVVSAAGASPGEVLLAALVAGVPVAFLLSSLAARPLERVAAALRDGVQGLRSGDFSLRLVSERTDEVGQLVDSYNAIAEALGRERGELRQRELLLDTMLESSDVAILLANAADRVLYGSRAARRLFGNGRRIEGRSLRELTSSCPEPLRSALAAGTDAMVTVAVGEAEESFHVSRRTFDLNARRHTLLMVRHVTPELRRQEVAIWKKVIRIIGHEIGNSLAPVRSLVHSARLIRAGAGEPERLDTILDTIDESAARLHRFVSSYARFARLPEPRLEDVDLPSFLAQLQAIEPFRLAGEVPRRVVRIDSAQAQQALINLLKNAREADSPPGDVEVAVDELGDGSLAIRVADRGRGMSAETLAKAVLPYYSTKRDGSGLGLALSREIFEAHGGRLHIANRQGGGVEVTCTLPPRANGLGEAIEKA